MAVLSVQISTTGQVPNTSGLGLGLTQQTPTPIYINTNDTLATVTTTGYLNASVTHFQYPYTNWQMAEVYTTDSGVVWLRISITFSSGLAVYSLVAPSESGSITTPTVANQIAYATNTLGTIAASGLSTALFNAGNISAGLSTGTAGILESYPGAATSGKLIVAAVTNSGGNFNTTISNAASVGQSQVLSIPDTGASTANFIVSKLTGTQHITVGALEVDAGVISSGISTGGTAGGFIAYPATTTNGSLRLTPVGNVGNFASTISDVTGVTQATVYTLPDALAATARFLVGATATPFVSGNLPVASGTGGLMVDSGIAGSGATGNALQVLTTTVTLNQAAIQGAYGAPAVLIAAPASGKTIVLYNAQIYTNFQTAAFANGGVAIVQYDSTVHGAGTNALSATIPAAEVTAAASQIYSLVGQTAGALTGVTAKGIYFSNQTGAFTAGDAASTIVITLTYAVLTATV